MNAMMSSKTPRTNKIATTVVISLTTLVIGLVIGAAAAETGSGLTSLTRKANPAMNVAPPVAAGDQTPAGLETGNPFQEMRDLQAQIDQSFDKTFERFHTDPRFSYFKDYPGYSLSLDVRDLKDRYEVQADLPDAKASDVHVSLKNGQTLNVEVNRKETQTSDQKNTTASVVELGQYDQTVQLPTPVKADQMKIQREGHELVVTIPKAA